MGKERDGEREKVEEMGSERDGRELEREIEGEMVGRERQREGRQRRKGRGQRRVGGRGNSSRRNMRNNKSVFSPKRQRVFDRKMKKLEMREGLLLGLFVLNVRKKKAPKKNSK